LVFVNETTENFDNIAALKIKLDEIIETVLIFVQLKFLNQIEDIHEETFFFLFDESRQLLNIDHESALPNFESFADLRVELFGRFQTEQNFLLQRFYILTLDKLNNYNLLR